MSGPKNPLATLRSTPPKEVARLAYRKLVYRKIAMGRFGARAGLHTPVDPPTPRRIEVLGPDSYRRVLGTSPHLTSDDLADFDRQASRCIVAYDGDRVAASTWMTWGDVHVYELHRTLPVPEGEHFSTRSFVHPDYRGQSLLSHMIQRYAATVGPADEIWGLVYHWNVASIRSLDRIGWLWSGEYWTTFTMGMKRSGRRRFAPRPAMDGARPK